MIVKPTTQLHPNTAFTYINVNIYCMEREKGREREKVRVSESTFGRGRGRRRNNREWKDWGGDTSHGSRELGLPTMVVNHTLTHHTCINESMSNQNTFVIYYTENRVSTPGLDNWAIELGYSI